MSVVNVNRRQFLLGAGGALLALPTLSSLLPRNVRAQSQVRPRFVCVGFEHGAVSLQNMYPAESTLTERMSLAGDHEIKRGALQVAASGGRASVSPTLAGSSSVLTPQLAAKMNVLQGLDLAWNYGHGSGIHLGNYAQNDGGEVASDPRPTIDQIMAWSSSFYPDVSGIRQRSMHVGLDGRWALSWGYSNPQTKSGPIQAIPTSYSSKDLFDSIFVQSQSEQPQNPRVPVVDRVFSSYKMLHDGAFGDARRLSAKDKQRLEDHMDRIAELQRRVNVAVSCGGVSPPSRAVDKGSEGYSHGNVRPDLTIEFYTTFNDVIAAAFMCGTSRIAVIHPAETFLVYGGDWHQQVAHTAQHDAETQKLLADSFQKTFEHVFLDLAAKLDVEEENGKTYLDNTLMMFSQESGYSTHDPISVPVVTAGSAAGFLRTGSYIDYRRPAGRSGSWIPGLLYNQLLATALQAVGVSPQEFERNGEKGYGSTYTNNTYGDAGSMWPDRVRREASNILPYLKA